MSLKHALLGFINYGPMTGYELKKFFDTSVAHFWNAELSQIYPALKQLEGEGLVEMKVEVQEDRPNRKVYSITDTGRRELLDWLATPAQHEQVREPILIKVFFGSSLPKPELISVLQNCADETRTALTYLQYAHQFVDKFVESIGLQHEALFWHLTIDCGLRSTWPNWSGLKKLSRRSKPPTIPSSKTNSTVTTASMRSAQPWKP